MSASGRVLGVDLGSKRIGLALSNQERSLATPLKVLQRTTDRTRDHQRLADEVVAWEVEQVVVGLPLSLDGSVGPAALAALDEVATLACRLPVPVETYDERLTTTQAHRSLAATGQTARQRRHTVDMVAAAIVLQAWLDRHHGPDPSLSQDQP